MPQQKPLSLTQTAKRIYDAHLETEKKAGRAPYAIKIAELANSTNSLATKLAYASLHGPENKQHIAIALENAKLLHEHLKHSQYDRSKVKGDAYYQAWLAGEETSNIRRLIAYTNLNNKLLKASYSLPGSLDGDAKKIFTESLDYSSDELALHEQEITAREKRTFITPAIEFIFGKPKMAAEDESPLTALTEYAKVEHPELIYFSSRLAKSETSDDDRSTMLRAISRGYEKLKKRYEADLNKATFVNKLLLARESTPKNEDRKQFDEVLERYRAAEARLRPIALNSAIERWSNSNLTAMEEFIKAFEKNAYRADQLEFIEDNTELLHLVLFDEFERNMPTKISLLTKYIEELNKLPTNTVKQRLEKLYAFNEINTKLVRFSQSGHKDDELDAKTIAILERQKKAVDALQKGATSTPTFASTAYKAATMMWNYRTPPKNTRADAKERTTELTSLKNKLQDCTDRYKKTVITNKKCYNLQCEAANYKPKDEKDRILRKAKAEYTERTDAATQRFVEERVTIACPAIFLNQIQNDCLKKQRSESTSSAERSSTTAHLMKFSSSTAMSLLTFSSKVALGRVYDFVTDEDESNDELPPTHKSNPPVDSPERIGDDEDLLMSSRPFDLSSGGFPSSSSLARTMSKERSDSDFDEASEDELAKEFDSDRDRTRCAMAGMDF